MSATEVITTIENAVETTVEAVATTLPAAEENATNLAESVLGQGEMSFADTLLISVEGFGIVFAVLGFLAIFVFLMGKFFDKMNSKKAVKKEAKEEAPVSEPAKGQPLPDNQSAGDLTLINTTEEEAAVIMAITSNKLGIPLNRLKFNSIKLTEDEK